MNSARSRRCLSVAALAVVLVASVCLFVGFGHGFLHVPVPEGHHGAEQDVITFCLVLFTVLTPLALAAAALARRVFRHAGVQALAAIPLAVVVPHPLEGGGARASPAWLQRFRN